MGTSPTCWRLLLLLLCCCTHKTTTPPFRDATCWNYLPTEPRSAWTSGLCQQNWTPYGDTDWILEVHFNTDLRPILHPKQMQFIIDFGPGPLAVSNLAARAAIAQPTGPDTRAANHFNDTLGLSRWWCGKPDSSFDMRYEIPASLFVARGLNTATALLLSADKPHPWQTWARPFNAGFTFCIGTLKVRNADRLWPDWSRITTNSLAHPMSSWHLYGNCLAGRKGRNLIKNSSQTEIPHISQQQCMLHATPPFSMWQLKGGKSWFGHMLIFFFSFRTGRSVQPIVNQAKLWYSPLLHFDLLHNLARHSSFSSKNFLLSCWPDRSWSKRQADDDEMRKERAGGPKPRFCECKFTLEEPQNCSKIGPAISTHVQSSLCQACKGSSDSASGSSILLNLFYSCTHTLSPDLLCVEGRATMGTMELYGLSLPKNDAFFTRWLVALSLGALLICHSRHVSRYSAGSQPLQSQSQSAPRHW